MDYRARLGPTLGARCVRAGLCYQGLVMVLGNCGLWSIIIHAITAFKMNRANKMKGCETLEIWYCRGSCKWRHAAAKPGALSPRAPFDVLI